MLVLGKSLSEFMRKLGMEDPSDRPRAVPRNDPCYADFGSRGSSPNRSLSFLKNSLNST